MFTMSEALITSQYEAATNQRFACQFKQAKFRGMLKKIWAVVTGVPNNLIDVDTVMQGKSIRSCRYAGSQTVAIRDIKGSENRCQDFDQDFNPLQTHNRDRWASVVSAWAHGIFLPAVDLIKIGDVFIVRDGHHRVSVAKFMGSEFIDARVTEWMLGEE